MQRLDPHWEMIENSCPRRVRLQQRAKETPQEKYLREEKIRQALLKVKNMPNLNKPKRVKRVLSKPENADLTTDMMPDTAFVTYEVSNKEALAIVKADTLAAKAKEAKKQQKLESNEIINIQSSKNLLDDDERNVEDDKAVMRDAMKGL